MLRRICKCKIEKGSVLAIGMLTLAILSLIGVAATTSSSIEAGVSGNDRVHREAFFAGEYALAIGERVIQDLTKRYDFDEDNTVGRYCEQKSPDCMKKMAALTSLKWNDTDSVEVAADDIPDGLNYVVQQLPHYTLEQRFQKRDNLTVGIGVPTSIYYFNVTAQGRGSHRNADVTLRSVYAKRFD
jgi:Tfp pilus assembly protein PilX